VLAFRDCPAVVGACTAFTAFTAFAAVAAVAACMACTARLRKTWA
jgi:hypothetical protein